MIATLEKYAPWMLGIMRIVVALVYMEHGTQKLFHFPPQMRFGGGGGTGERAGRAVQSAVEGASSALQSAANTATSALQAAADTASSALNTIVSAASSAPPSPGGGGMPPSMQGLFLFAGILETFGGLALVLGFLTRPIAFLVAGEVAYIFWFMDVAHAGTIFPASNGGEDAVLFCFPFLYLVFAGSGAFALDNVLWKRRPAA